MTTLDKILAAPINEDELAASICKDSFFEFLKEFWSVVIHETPVWNWHIEYLCNELQKIAERVKARLPAEYDYYIINIPPGSSKSTIVSIMYPMWVWTMDPTQRFICSSGGNGLSVALADKSRFIFRSDKYRKYFPEVKIDLDNDSKSHFKNKSGGERQATSTGASIIGSHAHQILIDDPVDPQGSKSDAERVTANQYLDETLSTRKVDKLVTPTILIMQRLHDEDCTGHLLKKQKEGVRIMHICLPAELNPKIPIMPAELAIKYQENGGLFDPVRLSRTAIGKLRVQLGSYGAAGQLDQMPAPLGGGILKKHWFEIVDKNIPQNAIVKFKLDTAYTEQQKNDPTGLLGYFMEDGTMYIVNAEEQRLELPELVNYIPVYCRMHGYSSRSTIKVEPKASGKSVVQVLRKADGVNILEDRPPVGDKTTRVNTCSPTCEALRVKLLRGSWNEAFLDQVSGFPVAIHDDMLDCLTSAILEEFVNVSRGPAYRRAN